MSKRISKTSVAIGAALAMLAIAALMVFSSSASLAGSTAAPLAAPTPVAVSSSVDKASGVLSPVYFFNKSRVTTTARAGKINTLAQYGVLDLQYVIVMPTVNTTTLKLQFSNDAINWVDGPVIATNVVTNETGLNQYENFGLFTAIYATVANTNPVTITTVAVAK